MGKVGGSIANKEKVHKVDGNIIRKGLNQLNIEAAALFPELSELVRRPSRSCNGIAKTQE